MKPMQFKSFKTCLFNYLLMGFVLFSFSAFATVKKAVENNAISFTENKGQITDQNLKSRKDILFIGGNGHLNFHLRPNGVSYQQYRVTAWSTFKDPLTEKTIQTPSLTTIYRLDQTWLNCNASPKIETGNVAPGYNNYYISGFVEGIKNVRSFEQVLYKNLYNGIDLKWYTKNGYLKYDFIIAPFSDPSQIQTEINGATSITINQKGELVIVTPLGTIIEEAPLVIQNHKTLKSNWVLKQNIVSFQIQNIDPRFPVVIDPGVRQWGTYYGGTGGDSGLNTICDPTGNVYLAGTTNSTGGNVIATVGSHQVVYGGGVDNAYLAKFNPNGVRIWSTYYGGNVREIGSSCALDGNGNIVLCGYSLGSGSNAVATPGCHQYIHAGQWDAFLVKFNNNGVRQWGTFYGGMGVDYGFSVAADVAGNIYLGGKTDAPTTTAIATPGSHQSSFGGIEDAFIVKFNPSGVRQWATYYGGTGTDIGRGICVDASANIYLAGWSDNTQANVIGSPGSHQNAPGGNLDGFVVKFNTNGVRQWGTQYGGGGIDQAYDVDVDLNSNVYITGKTASSTSIATVGSHQPFFAGGNFDAFITCFNSSGVRQWGTYYGSNADEEAWTCAVHKTGHIYLAGLAGASTGTAVATVGSHQPNYGGGTWDCFIAQFDPNGLRMWGSFYGETGDDVLYGCSTDNFYNLFITGSTDTNTGTSIATVGSHQPAFSGGFGDGFLAKFYDCPAPVPPSNSTPSANLVICSGNTTTLHVNSASIINWFASATSTASLGSGTSYTTPVLTAGTYTYFVEASSCTVSLTRTPITVTVNPLPTLNIVANPTLLCAGKSATLLINGVDTYTWDSGANTNSIIVMPSATTIYSVSATNSFNCVNNNTINVTVYPLDPVSLTPSSYTSCLTIFGGAPITLTGTPSGGTFSGPNVSGNSLNPTALGVFNPVYTYTNPTTGCVNSATISIQVYSCMGLNTIDANDRSVLVYPNPTKGHVFVESFDQSIKEITLTDVNGKLIYNEKLDQKKVSVNLTPFAKGIYIIKIKTSDQLREMKLIKE